jgi:hypothetical protein
MRNTWLVFLWMWVVPLHGQEVPRCVVELGTTFFPYPLLAGAFSYTPVYQNQWSNIYTALQQQSRQVPALLQAKASRMRPNPLYPYQPLVVSGLLQQTLYEVFAQVMRSTRLVSEVQIQQMFHTLRVQQGYRLQACFGPQAMADQMITE